MQTDIFFLFSVIKKDMWNTPMILRFEFIPKACYAIDYVNTIIAREIQDT